MEFLTHNESKQASKGVKRVERALLRTGFSDDKSDKSRVLVAYKDLDTKGYGFYFSDVKLLSNGC